MIYLLTPTGGRPEAFALLVRYIVTQNYRDEMHWVVVDDCEPETKMPERLPWHIRVELVRPQWRWQPGVNTQAACLMVGLAHVPEDARLLIIEDDDVYLPQHVANMAGALEHYELVGEQVAKYYNIATQRQRSIPSARHASLASTGVRGGALSALRAIVGGGSTTKGIDFKLWQSYKGRKRLLDTQNVIGIKGLPGRAGIGVGHRATFGTPDNADVLGSWIGKHRAARYDQFRGAPA